MDTELSVALNFVISYLYNKLPRRRVDIFCGELENGLRAKFENHWYPDEPYKGSGFRCVRFNGEKLDPVVVEAARCCGLGVDDVQEFLPRQLTIWVDPGEVSYRIGENAPMKILYRKSGDMIGTVMRGEESGEGVANCQELDKEVQKASFGFNPCAESFRPIELSPTHSWPGSISPSTSSKSTSPVGPFFARPPPSQAPQIFTAASFAQTKFGSTKMKTQAQRPTRLSPTEIPGGVFVSAGGLVGGHSPVSPINAPPVWPVNKYPHNGNGVVPIPHMQDTSVLLGQSYLKPQTADPRVEALKEQQRVMLMQQQQQLQFQRMQEQLEQLNVSQQAQLNYQKDMLAQAHQQPCHDPLVQQHKLCNEPPASNSIAASLQSLYEQQQRELRENPQLGLEREEFHMSKVESEVIKDPFHTEPGPSVFDQLDWTNFVYNKPQLLVAN